MQQEKQQDVVMSKKCRYTSSEGRVRQLKLKGDGGQMDTELEQKRSLLSPARRPVVCFCWGGKAQKTLSAEPALVGEARQSGDREIRLLILPACDNICDFFDHDVCC